MTPEERAAEVRKAFTSEPESMWTRGLENYVAAAIRAAVLEEREACANLLDKTSVDWDGELAVTGAVLQHLAAAIRDRT